MPTRIAVVWLLLSAVAAGDDAAVDGLLHADADIRIAASDKLSEMGEDAVAPLFEVLQGSGQTHAIRAAYVLTKIGAAGRPSWPELMTIVGSRRTEPWRWSLAVRLVDRLDPSLRSDPAFVEALLDALGPRQHPMKQFAALKSLYYIDGETLEPRGDEVFQRLRDLFHSQLPQPVEIKIDSEAVTKGMSRRIVHVAVFKDDDVRRDKPQYMTVEQLAIASLRKVIAWDDPELQQLLTPWLARRVSYARPETQLDYAEMLAELDQGQIAAPVLVGLLTPSNETDLQVAAVEALGSMRGDAVGAAPELTRLLQDRDSDVRLAATRALNSVAQSLEPGSAIEGSALFNDFTSALAAAGSQIDFEGLVENPSDDRKARIDALKQCQASLQKAIGHSAEPDVGAGE